MAATPPPPEHDAPSWEIYALTDAEGRAFFIGETRRGWERRVREQRRAGRLGPREGAELLAGANPGGLRDIGAVRVAGHYLLEQLGLRGKDA